MNEYAILYLDIRKGESGRVLDAVWRELLADRLEKKVFYDGSVKSGADFRGEILRPGSLPFVVLRDGAIAAFCWLNNISGRMARTHFVIFRKAWGRKSHVLIGRHFFKYALTRKDGQGYLFDCLYGLTPEHNVLAWRASLDCGWRKVGIVPRACFVAGKGSVNGVMVCATRDILGIGDEETGAIWAE